MYHWSVGGVIRRFELCRRALDHKTVLHDRDLIELLEMEQDRVKVLARYRELEERVAQELFSLDEQVPATARPVIDLVKLTVTYVSVSGDTILTVTTEDGFPGHSATLEMERRDVLATSNPRNALLAVLTGFHTELVRFPKPDDLDDPGYKARGQLALMVGYEEAHYILGMFCPDWKWWRGEFERVRRSRRRLRQR